MSFPTSLTFFFTLILVWHLWVYHRDWRGGAARLRIWQLREHVRPTQRAHRRGPAEWSRPYWQKVSQLTFPPSLTLFLHSAPSQTLTFSSSSFFAFTHPFFSVVNGQRWNHSAPALALRLSHQCKCQTAGVSPRDGWGLSELHTRALNNSVQALRTGTVTVCGP